MNKQAGEDRKPVTINGVAEADLSNTFITFFLV